MGGVFRRLEEREIYRGGLISLAVGVFESPDGEQFEREVVHHPGAVAVVPVADDGSVLLVRQYRSAVGRDLLEIPAGKRDVEDEPPEETARRELAEEVGMVPGEIEKLGEFYNSPGFCDEHSIVFLARGLEECDRDAHGVEEQHMTIERVTLDEVPKLVASGALVDAKSIIGLCLAQERLRST